MKIIQAKLLKTGAVCALLVGLLTPVSVMRAAAAQSVTGEVVDLMCYLDHGAKGDVHASCAQKCIGSGGPVGLLTKDNQLYLIIGQHKAINAQLAPLAAKTITVSGKVVERNGVRMIENAEIQK